MPSPALTLTQAPRLEASRQDSQDWHVAAAVCKSPWQTFLRAACCLPQSAAFAPRPAAPPAADADPSHVVLASRRSMRVEASQQWSSSLWYGNGGSGCYDVALVGRCLARRGLPHPQRHMKSRATVLHRMNPEPAKNRASNNTQLAGQLKPSCWYIFHGLIALLDCAHNRNNSLCSSTNTPSRAKAPQPIDT